jgi:tripartite-type tricarboxylate transporter receptor subunit TctC
MNIRNLLCGALAILGVMPSVAQEQFPNRPVQLIMPFGPGGSDAMFRAFAASMSNVVKQQFVVINREGASGRIGTTQVATARPDGYTLLVGPTTPITNLPYTMKDLPYQFDSFDFVCQVFVNPFTITVRNDSPYKSLKDILDAARANPGKLNYGHAGVFTGPHINVETLSKQAGVKMQDLAFRGDAAMLLRLLGGDLDFGVNSTGAISTRPDVRPIAVFWDRRHPALPNVPTVTELGYPSSPPGYQGVFAPKGTPRAIIEMLEKSCEVATQDETLKGHATRQGVPLVYLKSADFAQLARADYELKGRIHKELGLKPD